MRSLVAVVVVLALASTATASNQYSLRFYGTGHNQLDRVRIQIDDNAAGANPLPNANIGAGSFTIDFWIRGTVADNPSAGRAAGDYSDYNWIEGNTVIDRDIWTSTSTTGDSRDFGLSVKGGRIEWGTAGGDLALGEHTLVGGTSVLDGTWRHVAVTRNITTGVKRIYVDGVLDRTSVASASLADLSYRDAGVASQVTPCGTGPWGPYLVLGAEKQDADQVLQSLCGQSNPVFTLSYPSFRGRVDEVRLWAAELTGSEIAARRSLILAPASYPTLVAYWRFEEGTGTVLADTAGSGRSGDLRPTPNPSTQPQWSTDAAPVTPESSVEDWVLR